MAETFKLTGGISTTVNTKKDPRVCMWLLSVQIEDKVQEVYFPLTCNFNITKNIGSGNNARFEIFNLAPSTRQSDYFFQDRLFNKGNKIVRFFAGYKGNLIQSFQGTLQEGYSRHEGTDVITTLDCVDFGMPYDVQNITFEKGTSFKDAYKTIATNAQGLEMGDIGTLEGEFQTNTSFSGSPLVLLNMISGQHTFIDDGVIKTLQNNESLKLGVSVIDSSSGLLGTPERRGACVVVTTIFNPNIIIGQMVEIKSTIQTEYNGVYKVYGLTHSGIISGAIAGQRTSTFNLLITDELPNSNYNVTKQKTKQGAKLVQKEEVYDAETSKLASSVYQYIRKNNGKIPNTKINDRISWKEMLGHDNTDSQRYSELTQSIIANCIVIANKLYNFLNANCAGQKITITSGWRSTSVNAKAGGKSDSVHLRGGAIDFKFNGLNTQIAFNKYFKPSTGWNKYTYYKQQYNIIHVQNTLGRGGAKR